MKYRSKPTVVDLIVFHPDQAATLVHTHPGLVLVHHPDGSHAIFNELHQSEINLEEGDFINVTRPGDYYPIKPDYVAEKYEPVEEPEPER